MPRRKLELEYLDDLLGSKMTWRILRVFVMHPFLSFRLTDLASRLQTSNKSILRVIRKLTEKDLVLGAVGSHEKYKINPDMRITRKIWSLFMSERVQRIPEEIMDIVHPYFEKVEGKLDAFIVSEYPSPEGMSIFKDDISVVIVSDALHLNEIKHVPESLDVSFFRKKQFSDVDNPVIRRALLNGVVLKGEEFVFSVLCSLKAFPPAYIAEKLKTYHAALARAKFLSGELQERQRALINKNVHDFETQFGIRERNNAEKSVFDRIDNLKALIAKNNYARYI